MGPFNVNVSLCIILLRLTYTKHLVLLVVQQLLIIHQLQLIIRTLKFINN